MKNKAAIEILMDIQSDWEDGVEYEALDLAIEALEKQILKTPMQNYYNEGDYTWECVKCEETVAEGQNYCHNCGQKLDLD